MKMQAYLPTANRKDKTQKK